ncbi:hypothetical protein [Streptomyces monashensis]|uniref:hypothetical protein n=1 Tax=Streptomyces monashensis TaxID=1678012 RepID=UPI003CCB7FDE
MSSTIARGSGRGTCGTLTSPAPRRPRVGVPDAEPELRTDTERPVERPDEDRDSRPDTERRDLDDRDERDDRDDWDDERELPLSTAPLVTPVGVEPTMPRAETTGASPHVSQYSSPPPTSSYDPSQPGR